MFLKHCSVNCITGFWCSLHFFLGSSFEVENKQYQYLYKIFAKPRIISLKMKLFFIWTFNLRMEPEIFQKGNFFKRLKPQTIPERWKGAIFSIQASSYLMLAKKKKETGWNNNCIGNLLIVAWIKLSSFKVYLNSPKLTESASFAVQEMQDSFHLPFPFVAQWWFALTSPQGLISFPQFLH